MTLPKATLGRQPAPQRKKSKSGNPARRAIEEREAASKAAAKPAGGAFGVPSGTSRLDSSALDTSQLPPGFEKFLGK